MKKIFFALISALLALSFTTCNAADDAQDIRIFSAANADGAITAATIEKAFEKTGFSIDGNNDMNLPFKARFGELYYKTYRLATVHNADLTAKLAAKYPSIGLLTPLSMSIYSDDKKKTMQISSLSLRGMSRITQIPMDNPDLIAYADLMEKALKAALPSGDFLPLNYTKVADMKISLATKVETEFEIDEDGSFDTGKEDFQEEFEGEMEPVGFLFPGFIGLNDELTERGVNTYDFYDTYSVCKLNVIYPVSKTHPEVGAFAPCTYYMYKKKGEATVHMGFPSVENWITATDIEDEASLKPLITAQKLFVDTINTILE
jgi:uncharacterized protein (DUF302 family)